MRKISAKSHPGDVIHGENYVLAIQGGYFISSKKNKEPMGVVTISADQPLDATSWELEKTDKTNHYTATASV